MSSTSPHDDAALLERWKAGDKAAGGILVRQYHDAVAGFLRHKVPEQDLEDVVANTFLGLVRSYANFKGHSSFKTYLFGIARNHLLDYYRKKYKKNDEQPDDLVDTYVDETRHSLSSDVRFQESTRKMLAVIEGELDTEQKLMLELFYWQYMTASAIAEVFGLGGGAVRARLKRLRDRIEEMMEARPPVTDEAENAEIEALLRRLREGIEL